MSGHEVLRWRETILGLPPKFRNGVSWASTQDGNVSEIIEMRSFQDDKFTFVVLFGMTSAKSGPLHRLSVVRFSKTSFALPKMTHTLVVEVPEDAGTIGFDVAPVAGFGAWVMLQFGSKQTNFYQIRTDAVFIDDPTAISGTMSAPDRTKKIDIVPACPCGVSQTLSFYGRTAEKKLYLVSLTESGFKAKCLGVVIDGRLRNTRNGLLAIHTTKWSLLDTSRSQASIIQEGKTDGMARDVCFFKTANGTDGAVVLNRSGEALVQIGKDISRIEVGGQDVTAIEIAPDKSILVGLKDGSVHSVAIYALDRPLKTMKFPYYTESKVTGICACPQGRVFVCVDGVLWETDAAIEAQDRWTMARYIGNILIVCILIYASLFIGM